MPDKQTTPKAQLPNRTKISLVVGELRDFENTVLYITTISEM